MQGNKAVSGPADAGSVILIVAGCSCPYEGIRQCPNFCQLPSVICQDGNCLAYHPADLAAFSAALDRRRLDYSTLLQSLTFPRPQDSEAPAPAAEEFLSEDRNQTLQLEDSNSLVSVLECCCADGSSGLEISTTV